jgi:pyruvate-ferredoxin/flavodoxin oxidoreductase
MFQHKKNIWGAIPGVIEMQSEAGAAGAVHGALSTGALATTFTASQGLLLMIPNMYKIAGEQTPFVMHVAARAIATHALSIFGDHSDVMAVRQTGFALLSSHNVQQAHDMAAIAHAATLRARVPFLHFFDGFRTSHEESTLTRIDDDDLRKLIPESIMLANRARGMTPDAPSIRGTAQNPDVFFQSREAANNLYTAVPNIVSDVMDDFEKITGRRYGLVDYVGDADAENIIVSMGSSCETIEETLPLLPRGVGLIKIHLFSPFPTDAFLSALPKTTKRIAVLDRTKEPGSIGEPLYLNVRSIVSSDIAVFGGRYGLGSKEFKPRDVKAIAEGLIRNTIHHNFTVGIDDDLTKLSLKTDPAFRIEPATGNPRAALMYGIGSDGTVGAVKNIVKIVGDNSELYPQSYAVYDSKKSGGLTASHLRFWDRPIQAQYLVESADFISVSNFMIAQRFDVFSALTAGGTVMINTGLAPDVAFANLPRAAQEHLIRMRAHVYFLDANAAAHELGLGNRINTFIMLNFFNLTKIIDPIAAANAAKAAIEKSYKKKGMDVVAANWAAVDRAAEFLHDYKLPSGISNFAPDFVPAMTLDTPANIAGTLGEMAAQRGDNIPVSAFRIDGILGAGQYPVGTAKYEKRAISPSVAVCDLTTCIQCGKCSMLCPHAAIRQNVVDKDTRKQFAEQIEFVDYKTPELGPDLAFTLNISPADCTGCGVCVKNCPVRALRMESMQNAAENQTAFDAATGLPEFSREKLNLNIPKHIELLPHYFEFSGACAGCGETPYIKTIAHLFGDRMVVANATGCSSIYGGNLPTTPWTCDANGRGPAWSNSLFEDNAEYGLGMRIALNQRRATLRSLLFELEIPDVLKIFDETDPARQREIEMELRGALGKNTSPRARMAESLLGDLVEKSVWIIGGDGWAYDIGYGGLDHVLHSGENVNILVLDTEGYSNTGGQQSKSTPFGASMKFAIGGKEHAKKDLGMIAMMSGAYVAQIAIGANQAQAVRALREAEAFPGPSIILAYSPCIAHGFNLQNGVEHQMQLVASNAWELYRFDPRLIEQGKNPLTMDSAHDNPLALEDFLKTESRFAAARAVNSNFGKLVQAAKDNNEYRRELKRHIANFAVMHAENAKKENGEG